MLERAGVANDVESARAWCAEMLDGRPGAAAARPMPLRSGRAQGTSPKDGVLRCSGYTGVRLFTNHIVLDAEGRPLRHMKEKTLRSLMRQGKAKVVATPSGAESGGGSKPTNGEEAAPVVHLNFAPLDRYVNLGPERVDRNSCVGCASGDVARCYVVPRVFLVHLPLAWKSSNCHDIVLLCPRCRAKVDHHQVARSEALLLQYGGRQPASGLQGCANEAPLTPEERQAMAKSKAILKHRRSAVGCGPGRHLLPERKQLELEADIRAFLRARRVLEGGSNAELPEELAPQPLTEEELKACATLGDRAPPAQRAVEAILEKGNASLLEWVRAWRQLFLDSVQPRYLPESWSVDFDVAAAASHSDGASPSPAQEDGLTQHEREEATESEVPRSAAGSEAGVLSEERLITFADEVARPSTTER